MYPIMCMEYMAKSFPRYVGMSGSLHVEKGMRDWVISISLHSEEVAHNYVNLCAKLLWSGLQWHSGLCGKTQGAYCQRYGGLPTRRVEKRVSNDIVIPVRVHGAKVINHVVHTMKFGSSLWVAWYPENLVLSSLNVSKHLGKYIDASSCCLEKAFTLASLRVQMQWRWFPMFIIPEQMHSVL